MSAESQSWSSTSNISPKSPPAPSFLSLPPAALVTNRRLDLAVKARFFGSLLHGGEDKDAERVYRWHIATRIDSNRRAGLGMDTGKARHPDLYVIEAKNLLASMQRQGFRLDCAIPLDPDGELLNGSHRTASALALGLASVPVVKGNRKVFAPAWDEGWFIANKCPADDLERIRKDFAALNGLRNAG